MALQETFIFSDTEDLDRPSGVAFGPPCSTKAQDIEAWNNAKPIMLDFLKTAGFPIGILVQTRNGRRWNDDTRRFDFNYGEDYIVAAYAVHPSLGRPWRPGALIMHWLDSNAFETGPTSNRTLDLIFQCSPKGCNLTKKTAMHFVTFHEKSGSSRSEAIPQAMSDLLRPTKQGSTERTTAGWQGGYFPGAKTRTTGMGITFTRGQAPKYQAPTPPPRK